MGGEEEWEVEGGVVTCKDERTKEEDRIPLG